MEWLNVVFKADTKQFDEEVEKALTGIEKLKDDLGKIGSELTLKVTTPLLGLGTAAVMAASNAEEMESKFKSVFKELSGDVRAWATTQSEAVGRSEYDFVKYLATLQDTLVPMGMARDEAAELSKALTTLAVDVASFNDQAESDVIANFTSALIGNHEAVRSYGVMITEATLNQKLMNMGLKEGTKAATEQQKLLARANILFDNTSDAQGDAARTSQSFANQVRAMTADLKKMQVQLGQEIIPTLKTIIPIVREWIQEFNDLSPSTKSLVVQVGALVAILGPLATGLRNMIILLQLSKKAMMRHPIGLLAITVGGVAYAFKDLNDEVKVTKARMAELEKMTPSELKNLPVDELEAYIDAVEYQLDLAEKSYKTLSGGLISDPGFQTMPGEKETQEGLAEKAGMRVERLKTLLERLQEERDIASAEIDTILSRAMDADVDVLSDFDDVVEGSIGSYKALIKETKKAILIETDATQLTILGAKLREYESDLKELESYVAQGAEIVPTGKIAELEYHVGKLQDKLKSATSDEQIILLNEQIDILQNKIKELKNLGKEGDIIPEVKEGTIASYQKLIEVLQAAQLLVTSNEAYVELQKQIDELLQKIQAITNGTETLTEQEEARLRRWETFVGLYNTVGEIFADALTDAIIQGEKFTDVLKNIGRYALQMGIQKLLGGFLTGGLFSTGMFSSEGGGLFGSLLNFLKPENVANAAAMGAPMTLSGLGYGGMSKKVDTNIVVEGVIRGEDIYISNKRGGDSYGR